MGKALHNDIAVLYMVHIQMYETSPPFFAIGTRDCRKKNFDIMNEKLSFEYGRVFLEQFEVVSSSHIVELIILCSTPRTEK